MPVIPNGSCAGFMVTVPDGIAPDAVTLMGAATLTVGILANFSRNVSTSVPSEPKSLRIASISATDGIEALANSVSNASVIAVDGVDAGLDVGSGSSSASTGPSSRP